jgi:hypothetical protein
MTIDMDTIEGVTERIIALYKHGANEMRGAKPAEHRAHHAHLADLHELRARYFRAARDEDLAVLATAAGLDTVAFALSQAAELDDRQAAFFRTQAGAR